MNTVFYGKLYHMMYWLSVRWSFIKPYIHCFALCSFYVWLFVICSLDFFCMLVICSLFLYLSRYSCCILYCVVFVCHGKHPCIGYAFLVKHCLLTNQINNNICNIRIRMHLVEPNMATNPSDSKWLANLLNQNNKKNYSILKSVPWSSETHSYQLPKC